jgi:hypothetical protein
MAMALIADDWIEAIEYPAPSDFATAEAWVDAFFEAESARGPQHGADPVVSYGFLWTLWLSVVPYGLWSKQISGPSMAEYAQSLTQLENVLGRALDHFGLALREGTTLGDLACAIASLVEGAWLNQCLTVSHPSEPGEPIATVLKRSGHLLWLGATQPRTEASSS